MNNFERTMHLDLGSQTVLTDEVNSNGTYTKFLRQCRPDVYLKTCVVLNGTPFTKYFQHISEVYNKKY